MMPEILSNIKPAYASLVNYSQPGDAPLIVPDTQELNESVFDADTPVREINMEEDKKWAKELRQAADAPPLAA